MKIHDEFLTATLVWFTGFSAKDSLQIEAFPNSQKIAQLLGAGLMQEATSYAAVLELIETAVAGGR